MLEINIAVDYTKTPGGRFREEGEFSGEDFRETLLKPKFDESNETGSKLKVILDGGYGYGSSFLEEAFGGLVRETGDKRVADIEIVSTEEPKLKEDVEKYIREALKKL